MLVTATAALAGCVNCGTFRTTTVGLPVQSSPFTVSTQPANSVAAPSPMSLPGTGFGWRDGTPAGCPSADYWIISSRQCDATAASDETSCCLKFFHHTADNSLVPADHEAFHGSLNPQVPVCFVIHGSYNGWGDVVEDSRRINEWIRSASPERPLQVVFFTWPSDGTMPLLFQVDIAILGRRSSAHAPYLAQVIAQLPPNQPVSIVGHSHGARVASAALHLLDGGCTEEGCRLIHGPVAPRRMRAVFVAAALDHNWLNPGDRYGQALGQVERVLLMRNSSDTALGMYAVRKPFGERSLGRYGLGGDDRFLLDGLNCRIVELDVAPFVGTGHAFAHYYRHPELAQAIVPYVYFHGE